MGVGRWPEGRRQPELDPLLRWPLPEEWSVAEAVAVPYAYSLVYYFLQVKVKVRAGSSILVHEGSSAIGQAAIRVAAQLGCDPIFTTVGSGRQRALVTELFPQMEPRYVLSHEDGVSFELAVRRMTRGRGVHLVLNTLGQSKLKATLRCLRLSGTVLQLNREGGVDCDGGCLLVER
ncbi:hypothetical protein ONE63_006686 [Megalurothrips usitatus]|uniref:Enoyl reductase (ER) domain-containing protein n=1 Tax=Megalurothrips usitatus TaxID=439358 RepID=A0AAV7Y0G0_9NEOP|nr:hypothetical protein ONE63_006686 [Megalurothrips usitatus]